MALGALLLILSNWLSRMVAFPYQLPVGLFASILGRALSDLPSRQGSAAPWLLARVTRDLEEIGEVAHHGPEDLFIAMMTFLGAFALMF